MLWGSRNGLVNPFPNWKFAIVEDCVAFSISLKFALDELGLLRRLKFSDLERLAEEPLCEVEEVARKKFVVDWMCQSEVLHEASIRKSAEWCQRDVQDASVDSDLHQRDLTVFLCTVVLGDLEGLELEVSEFRCCRELNGIFLAEDSCVVGLAETLEVIEVSLCPSCWLVCWCGVEICFHMRECLRVDSEMRTVHIST